MWADRGDFLKLPFAKYCIEGVLKQDSSNVMLSIAQSDIGDWGAPLFGHFHAFVPCFTFSPGCEFASQTGRNESCPRPWIHEKMEIMNVDKVVSMTTYPLSTTCWWYQVAKYRSDKLLATHPFLIMDHVTGLKSFGEVFMCLSAAYLTNVDQRWQRWLKVARGLLCLPGFVFCPMIRSSGEASKA